MGEGCNRVLGLLRLGYVYGLVNNNLIYSGCFASDITVYSPVFCIFMHNCMHII